jgi:hypothetical protein
MNNLADSLSNKQADAMKEADAKAFGAVIERARQRCQGR